MKAAAALLLCTVTLLAQEPVRVGYACPPEDLDSFGLACSDEDPCAVYLDLSSVEVLGAGTFITGNLHTESTTLYSVLLMSEDAGKTWTEPYQRVRSAALEQIQFVDSQHGWVGGEILEPLPRDPFLLLTSDGGTTWRESPLFEESRFGSIARFWFDSPTTGELIFDRSQGKTARYELYETMTGGENWMIEELSDAPLQLKKAPPKTDAAWRVRADAATKTYRVERAAAGSWEAVASFIIHVVDCK